jgi:hypothetical protein
VPIFSERFPEGIRVEEKGVKSAIDYIAESGGKGLFL